MNNPNQATRINENTNVSSSMSEASSAEVDQAKAEEIDMKTLNEMLLDEFGNVRLDVFLSIFLARHGESALLTGDALAAVNSPHPFGSEDDSSSTCGQIFVSLLWDFILKTYYWDDKVPSQYISERTAHFVDDMFDYVREPIGTIQGFTEFTRWIQVHGLNEIQKANFYDLCPLLRVLAVDNVTIKKSDTEARKFYMQTMMKALPIGTIMLPLHKCERLNKCTYPKVVSTRIRGVLFDNVLSTADDVSVFIVQSIRNAWDLDF